MKASIEDIQGVINLLTAFRNELVKVKEKPQLTTPPGIKFWTVNGKTCGLFFNEDEEGRPRQMLHYCQVSDQFEVSGVYAGSTYLEDLVECLPLTPCKREGLVPGIFTFSTGDREPSQGQISRISMYELQLPSKERVYCGNKGPSKVDNEASWNYWKVGK